ncbi:MAG: hypothetical protein KKA73_30500 [Chloroflexi bacterium]|nr:hypothetical protein [Chloroflexota bacterium]
MGPVGTRTALPIATALATRLTPTAQPSVSIQVRNANRQAAGWAGLLAIYWAQLTPSGRQAALATISQQLDELDQALAGAADDEWGAQQQAAIRAMRQGLLRYRAGDAGGLAQLIAGSAANAQLWETWLAPDKKRSGCWTHF